VGKLVEWVTRTLLSSYSLSPRTPFAYLSHFFLADVLFAFSIDPYLSPSPIMCNVVGSLIICPFNRCGRPAACFSVKVPNWREGTVSDLKDAIREVTTYWSVSEQRLVFEGKELKDNEKLSTMFSDYVHRTLTQGTVSNPFISLYWKQSRSSHLHRFVREMNEAHRELSTSKKRKG